MGRLQQAGFAVAGLAAIGLELIALAGWQGWYRARIEARPVVQLSQAAAAALPLAAKAAPVVVAEPASPPARPEDGHYAKLRGSIRWVATRLGNEKLPTPDLHSRMMLAKSAAQRAGLAEVGLGFQDVYGIINAETSWVPRMGASKDGTPNLGVAQFEPATARALGLRDPHDLVEAVHVAAAHMKEAALWSRQRIAGLKLPQNEQAAKLREGVSIYYNLSSRGRAAWNGRNTGKLPPETQRHILNARLGAQEAAFLDTQLQGARPYRPDQPVVVTAQAGPTVR